jgi:hypothetical protein
MRHREKSEDDERRQIAQRLIGPGDEARIGIATAKVRKALTTKIEVWCWSHLFR